MSAIRRALRPLRSPLTIMIILFTTVQVTLILLDIPLLPTSSRPRLDDAHPSTFTPEHIFNLQPDPEPQADLLHQSQRPELPAFCDLCSPSDTICNKWGKDNLARSRAHEGSHTRLRRVIRKAHSGDPIKIGVLGGSVSAGHGVHDPRDRWHGIYAQWWRDTFFAEQYSQGRVPEGEDAVEWVMLSDGSMAATQSEYLQSCHAEHIDDDVDIVVVELAINDMRRDEFWHAFEYLLRSLLVLPNEPAIVNLQTMGLHSWEIVTGGDLETAIAMYYDIPTINVRNILLPHLLQHTELDYDMTRHYFSHNVEKGWVDLRHMSGNGHRAMGEILSSMTQRVYCDELQTMRREDEEGKTEEWVSGDRFIPGRDVLEYIPRLRMFQPYDNHTHVVPMKPQCMSMTSSKHPLVASHTDGWEIWEATQSTTRKVYYRATVPGSLISFRITIGPLGRARVTYLRSKSFGLGSCWCWVQVQGDGDGVEESERSRRFGAKVDGWWDKDKINLGSALTIAEHLPPGDHTLHCRLLDAEQSADPGKGTEFRIIAVDSA